MGSYHDVEVYVDGVRYRPGGDYALELTCTKAGGWQLWWDWLDRKEMIGGEFEGGGFCVAVKGHAICGRIPERPVDAQVGWSGEVRNG